MMAPLQPKSNSRITAVRTLFLSKVAVQLHKEVDRVVYLPEYHLVSYLQAWKAWQHRQCKTQPCVHRLNGTLGVVPHSLSLPNLYSVKSAQSHQCRSSRESCTITQVS